MRSLVQHDAFRADSHGGVGDLGARRQALLRQTLEDLRRPDHRDVRGLAEPEDLLLDLGQPLVSDLDEEIPSGDHDPGPVQAQGREEELGKVLERGPRLNLEDDSLIGRLRRSPLDWRLLCPGPMVEEPPLGIARLRISLERLPVEVPAFGRALPGALFLPVFAHLVPQMIISYADAAALMLAQLSPGGEMSRHRVGVALPLGMRGHKQRWTARPKSAT